jgi:hypothetical protein
MLAFDAGKRSHNNGVCVPTIDGVTYFGKLIEVIEVEYYDRTRYVLPTYLLYLTAISLGPLQCITNFPPNSFLP